MTRLAWLNFIFLQWLTIRLARVCLDTDEGLKQIGWCLMGPVLPLSGWWGRYVGRPTAFFEFGFKMARRNGKLG